MISSFEFLISLIGLSCLLYPIIYMQGYRAGAKDSMDIIIKQNNELNKRRDYKNESTNI